MHQDVFQVRKPILQFHPQMQYILVTKNSVNSKLLLHLPFRVYVTDITSFQLAVFQH